MVSDRAIAILLTLGEGGLRREALLLVPDALDFFACACILYASISASASAVRNTGFTIGAATLALYVVMGTWFGSVVPHGEPSYMPPLLRGLQHVWFPVTVIWFRVRHTPIPWDVECFARMGSPLHLLIAAQLPGLVGMALVAGTVSGIIGSDPFGAVVGVIFCITLGGSVLSAVLSLMLASGPRAVVARRLAAGHAIYLVCLILTVVGLVLTSKPRYHGPGGF